jgi:maleate isomerase
MSAQHPGREYGSRGRVGLAVPQANPTAEPEAAALLPAGISLLASRITSREPEPAVRFVAYLEDFGQTLASYDILKLDAIGFACSASSYLVGEKRESEITHALSQRMGCPVITGGQAIRAGLAAVGARRVAVIAPYPPFVVEACGGYFAAAGHEIVLRHRVVTRTADTRTIYELGSADAIAAARGLDLAGADCLLFTGTGMPTLAALETLGPELGIPVLSTNLCLAWAMCRALGVEPPAGPHPLFNGWQARRALL